VGSLTVMLNNGSEEDIHSVGTYNLRFRGGNKLLVHDALYTTGVRVVL